MTTSNATDPATLSDAALNAEIRLLATGDDGSVEKDVPRLSWSRLVQAVNEWHLARVFSTRGLLDGFIPDDILGERRPQWLWDHRHEMPEERRHLVPDLESHVAAYREPAPDYAWPEVVEMCGVAGVSMTVSRLTNRACCGVSPWIVDTECNMDRRMCTYADLARTVRLAAVKALREVKGEPCPA